MWHVNNTFKNATEKCFKPVYKCDHGQVLDTLGSLLLVMFYFAETHTQTTHH